jgi:hypothetical protein
MKGAMQRAARRAWPRREKETSDAAIAEAGVALVGERNERCSKRRGGRGVGERKKRAMQRAAGQGDVKRKKRAIQRATLRARG